jgi:hypothetical protein
MVVLSVGLSAAKGRTKTAVLPRKHTVLSLVPSSFLASLLLVTGFAPFRLVAYGLSFYVDGLSLSSSIVVTTRLRLGGADIGWKTWSWRANCVTRLSVTSCDATTCAWRAARPLKLSLTKRVSESKMPVELAGVRSGGKVGPLRPGNLSLEPARLPVPAPDTLP